MGTFEASRSDAPSSPTQAVLAHVHSQHTGGQHEQPQGHPGRRGIHYVFPNQNEKTHTREIWRLNADGLQRQWSYDRSVQNPNHEKEDCEKSTKCAQKARAWSPATRWLVVQTSSVVLQVYPDAGRKEAKPKGRPLLQHLHFPPLSLFFQCCQAHQCGAIIQKHPSIITIYLSFTHSCVFVWLIFFRMFFFVPVVTVYTFLFVSFITFEHIGAWAVLAWTLAEVLMFRSKCRKQNKQASSWLLRHYI